MEDLYRQIRTRLTPERYEHTLGVIESAQDLARVYAVDSEKTELAALLHDCAKDLGPGELLKASSCFGIVVDEVERRETRLLHGPVGAAMAFSEYGVCDEDVLNAIRYHTTGRCGMSPLEKLIFLADYVEPGREFPGVDALRKLVRADLDKAVVTALDSTIEYVISNGWLLHPRGVEARNSMIMAGVTMSESALHDRGRVT